MKKAIGERAFGADERARQLRPGLMFYGLVGLWLASCAGALAVDNANDPGNWPKIAAIAVVIVGAILGTVLHEWAHAIVAYRGGDYSVADKGYLTLDPRRYTDPLLSIGMPILFLLADGLPLPGGAVWINRAALRDKWWATGVSLAGPALNIAMALALIAIEATGILDGHRTLHAALMFLAFIEIAVALLNLLPIPGLDGYGAIEPHLPDGVRAVLQPLEQIAFIVLLIVIFSTSALTFLFNWSTTMMTTLGVPTEIIAWGYELARPNLFGS